MDDYQLEIARNVARNGRLFCIILCAVALAAYLVTHAPAFAIVAALCAVPVGLSCLAEPFQPTTFSAALALAVYVISAGLGIALLVLLLRQ